jgi:exosortase/archaeosortase family protein
VGQNRQLVFPDLRSFVWACTRYAVVVFLAIAAILLPPVQQYVVAPLLESFAEVASGALNLLGLVAHPAGARIVGPQISVELVKECTGIEASIRLLGAIAVFPTRWRARGMGMLLGLGVMMAINFVRVVSLYWVGTFSSKALDIGHLYVWPVAVILAGLVTLLFWVDRFALPRR